MPGSLTTPSTPDKAQKTLEQHQEGTQPQLSDTTRELMGRYATPVAPVADPDAGALVAPPSLDADALVVVEVPEEDFERPATRRRGEVVLDSVRERGPAVSERDPAALEILREEIARLDRRIIALDQQHPSLEDVLNNPAAHAALRGVAERTFTIENVDFLDAVKEFKRDPSVQMLKDIYQRYIGPGSEAEVNIGYPTRKLLIELLFEKDDEDRDQYISDDRLEASIETMRDDKGQSTIFNDAYGEIYKLTRGAGNPYDLLRRQPDLKEIFRDYYAPRELEISALLREKALLQEQLPPAPAPAPGFLDRLFRRDR